MKYSMRRECNGRKFRYNYGTDNLEYLIQQNGKWVPFCWISVDRSDWRDKESRKAIMEDFCEMIADAEFGSRYNVVIA